ncbi:hypothetical protein [Variovorax sp. YR752]|uniref:hypothetical protein n=1 Tax=Variovorax sp. YR752 TaxID=1884383 RepID=UPI0031384669
MNVLRITSHAAVAAIACLAGWLMQPSAPETKAPPPVAPSPQRTAQVVDTSEPLIAVASDGNVTLRVEQQPLAWVLEQIAKQSGWSDVHKRATPDAVVADAADVPSVVPEVVPASPAQAEALLQTIRNGSETDRFDGLLEARSQGVPVSDELLKSLFETDASERVRMTAFETYLESRSGSLGDMRTALTAALYVPDATIQREAKQRLDELAESERIDAATPQAAAP